MLRMLNIVPPRERMRRSPSSCMSNCVTMHFTIERNNANKKIASVSRTLSTSLGLETLATHEVSHWKLEAAAKSNTESVVVA
jgi:hypothetical protein